MPETPRSHTWNCFHAYCTGSAPGCLPECGADPSLIFPPRHQDLRSQARPGPSIAALNGHSQDHNGANGYHLPPDDFHQLPPLKP